jgi:group I intron endonuclease
MNKVLVEINNNMKICGIYKITSPTNKVYIGQSIDCLKRFNDYKKYNKTGYQKRLRASFQKYGTEKHIFEIIEECSIELLNDRERYWQDIYNVIEKNGLNCKLTTTCDKSGQLSLDTINKIAKSNTGKKRTQNQKDKISESMLGKKRPNSGKSISEAHKKRHLDPKERIKHSIKLRKKVYQYDKNGNFLHEYISLRDTERQTGIHATSILKAIKISGYSKSAGGYLWSYDKMTTHPGYVGQVGVEVIQYDLNGVFIEEFISISVAAKKIGVNKSGIIRCCKGKQNKCGNFIWKYKK